MEHLGASQVALGQQKKRRGLSVAVRGRAGIPSLMELDLGERDGTHLQTTNL